MSPGQESVDTYLRANYPPCRKELDAYRAELRVQVQALRDNQWIDRGQQLILDDVLALLESPPK